MTSYSFSYLDFVLNYLLITTVAEEHNDRFDQLNRFKFIEILHHNFLSYRSQPIKYEIVSVVVGFPIVRYDVREQIINGT